MELLIKGVSELALKLTPEQIDGFELYYQELISWNQRMNLTAIVDYEEIQIKHFLDSLTTATVIPETVLHSGRMADVGSGGGFPGIPLKLVYSGIHLTLLESVGKKATFMEHLVGALGLNHIQVLTGRAENLALDQQLRESFDVVVSRGVARMQVLMEITLPFCRVGGRVITLKKGAIGPEMEASLPSIEILGGSLRETRNMDVAGLRDGRCLVVVDKVKATPAKFPRRPGMPAKHPL